MGFPRLAPFPVAVLLLFGGGSLVSGCSGAEPADLIITGGRVWTGVPESPLAEAVALRGERIAAIGDRATIEGLAGPETRHVDASGGLVVPGFIDAHVHFLIGGFNLASVQLRDAATPEEFTERIAAFAETVPSGTWITGGDWDHENWGGPLPDRDWIDAVTPEHPVWINRLDGHMALANSAALRAAGVEEFPGEVKGGEVVRTADGRLTGILKDNAMALVEGARPAPSRDEEDRALEAAMAHVAEQGVTSVHNMGTWEELAVFRRGHQAGGLDTRIYSCTPIAVWERLRDEVAEVGRGDEWLRIGCLKGFVDGSLGSRTAAFLAPYEDAESPDETGLYVNTPEDLLGWTSAADEAGLAVTIHAIGDRAIRDLLDIYERVTAENGPRDRRFRMEHVQHLHPDDVERFAEIGVIASMQPYHAIDDGRWAEEAIGPERARHTYAFRSLMEAGATVAFGSDWFVAPPTPLEGIYAAVTRRTLDGANPDGWVPDQKITVEQALTAYTRNAAYASFEEDLKGTLEPGKLADITVIDRDLFDTPPAELRDASVIATIVGGRVVFLAGGE